MDQSIESIRLKIHHLPFLFIISRVYLLTIPTTERIKRVFFCLFVGEMTDLNEIYKEIESISFNTSSNGNSDNESQFHKSYLHPKLLTH